MYTQVTHGDDVTDNVPGAVCGADGGAMQGAESGGLTEPTETEEHENKELNAEPGESSEAVEGEPPADEVSFNIYQQSTDDIKAPISPELIQFT